MTPNDTAALIASSPLAWISLNRLLNENQYPLEFANHRFMIDIYADNSSDIVCIKSAQVGFSVYAILKSFHELKYERRNIIYALPTRNIVQDFVVPKVNPLITSNPSIASDMGGDSVSLKKLGDRFIYFKGGSEREAISVSADTLVIDELDRMPSSQVVTMFDSRLQAALDPRRRRFSNPSGIGYGVDSLYTDSNQYHWFVRCGACNHEWFVDLESGDDLRHHIDRDTAQFVCGRCRAVLTDEMRRKGRWVAKYPQRARHGYWISQMMAPWVTAERILEQEEEMDIQTFSNFVLGRAYTPTDLIVNRATILRACAPSRVPMTGVVLGVDQNANHQIWVAMTAQGIIAHGMTDSWEELERLKLVYQAPIVLDPNPYPTYPKILADKYSDVYLCYFRESRDLSPITYKDQIVYADRTRLLDIVAHEISEAKLLFREHAYALEDYIADWQNLYRTTITEPDGRTKSTWLKKDNKESDYSFATAYARIALGRTMSGFAGTLVEPASSPSTFPPSWDSSEGMDMGDIVRDTFEEMDGVY